MAAQTNRDACGAPSVPGTRRPSRWPASSGASTETRTTPTGYAEVHIGADPNPPAPPTTKLPVLQRAEYQPNTQKSCEMAPRAGPAGVRILGGLRTPF